MVALIDQLLAVRHVFLSYREFWEILKNDMKALAISYCKCKRRAASHQKVFLTNHLIYLKDLIAGGDLSVKSDILEAEAALRSLFDTELEGHKIRRSCLLYTSPSPRDLSTSRMPSSA